MTPYKLTGDELRQEQRKIRRGSGVRACLLTHAALAEGPERP